MSAQPSPGPWREGPTDDIGQRGRLRVVDANGVQVADCEAPKRPDDPLAFVRPLTVDQANVRLVIAAPDLYEAARHAAMEWRLHGQLTDSCRVLEAAILKAQGKQGQL